MSFILFKKCISKESYTLAEVMIVIIIVSILAGFAIPQYQQTMERSYEKSAVMDLRSLTSSQEVYKIENGGYWVPGAIANTATINSTLRLNLVDTYTTHTCAATGTPNYQCRATYPTAGWAVGVDSTLINGAPYCIAATCPRCVAGGCPY